MGHQGRMGHRGRWGIDQAGEGIKADWASMPARGIEAGWGIKTGEGITAGKGHHGRQGIKAGCGYGIFAGLCLRLEDWPIYARVIARNKPDNLISGSWVDPDLVASEEK